MASLKDLMVMGPARFLSNIYGNLIGNASTSDKWKNPINITIAGESHTIDGSGNMNWAINTIPNTLTIKRFTSIADNLPAILRFQTNQTDNNITSFASIEVYDDHDTAGNGTNMVVIPRGNLIIGGGESAENLYKNTDLLKNNTGEELYLTADGHISFNVNCQTISDRKVAILDQNLYFFPSSAGDGAIGNSSSPWGTVATNILKVFGNGDAGGSAVGSPAVTIGSPTGLHLAMDNNEIMAKGSATTTGELYLNVDGGRVNIGPGGIKAKGLLEIQPNGSSAEGGEMHLSAAESANTISGIVLDNYSGNFRIFGIPSKDGTTVTGHGTSLEINPYAKTIKGGYTFEGTADKAKWLNVNNSLTYGASGLQYFNINGPAGTAPNANVTPNNNWYHILRMNHSNSAGYFFDIAAPLNDTQGIHWRQVRNGTNYGWYRILDSNNYSSFLDARYVNTSNAGDTMAGPLTISYAANSIMDKTTTNPRIVFADNGTQPVALAYTDYDDYRVPYGLKVIGLDGGNPWFECHNIYCTNLYGNATSATVANKLKLYETRTATTNLNKAANYGGAGSMFHLVATASTTTGKTPINANVLQMNWDHDEGFDSQFAISVVDNRAFFRSQVSAGTAWRELAHIPANTLIGGIATPVYVAADGKITQCDTFSDRMHTYNKGTEYYYTFGGSQDLNWKKVFAASHSNAAPASSQYIGCTVKGTIYYLKGNYDQNEVEEYPFQMNMSFISSTTVSNSCVLRVGAGCPNTIIRAVRVATNSFELQVRQPADWTEMAIKFSIKGNCSGKTPFSPVNSSNSTALTNQALTESKYISDKGNSTPITFAYSQSGLSSTSSLAAWNGYELRAISPSNITVGNATSASKLGTSTKGSASKPIYLDAGTPKECSMYAGGTAITLNGSSKAGSTASFYAPTAPGTGGQVLVSSGTSTSAPQWKNITKLPSDFSNRINTLEDLDNFLEGDALKWTTFGSIDPSVFMDNLGFDSGLILSIPWDTSTLNFGIQLAFQNNRVINDGTNTKRLGLKIREKFGSWGEWQTILHTGNYTDYISSSGGGGASGDFTKLLKNGSKITTQSTLDSFLTMDELKWTNFSDTVVPGISDGLILSIPWSGIYGAQLAFDDDQNGLIKIRGRNNSGWGQWYTILHSGNYSSYISGSGSGGGSGSGLSGSAGSSTKPVYLSNGTLTECSTYAGGTRVTLNGSSKASGTASFYAPTSYGTAGQILYSNGSSSAPYWGDAPTSGGSSGGGSSSSVTVSSVSWSSGNTAGPVLSIGLSNGTSKTATIPSASSSVSGIVTTGAQTFAGEKTFSGSIKITGGYYPSFSMIPSQAQPITNGTYSKGYAECNYTDAFNLWIDSDKNNNTKSRRGICIYGNNSGKNIASALALRSCTTSGTWESDRIIYHTGNVIYQSTQPTGTLPVGTIWLKPVS